MSGNIVYNRFTQLKHQMIELFQHEFSVFVVNLLVIKNNFDEGASVAHFTCYNDGFQCGEEVKLSLLRSLEVLQLQGLHMCDPIPHVLL